MTVNLKVVMMVFACCSYQSQAEELGALKVKEYKLENGLTVWLNEGFRRRRRESGVEGLPGHRYRPLFRAHDV